MRKDLKIFTNFINKYFSKLYSSKFIRFSITGGLGTITNLIIFYIICDIFKLPSNLGAIVAFLFAVTQNYFINHFWTFKNLSIFKSASFIDYIKFVGISLIGLGINLIIMNLILYYYKLPLKVIAQFFGIIGGLIFNFFGSKLFVFKG